MIGIDILVEEHSHILEFTETMRKACISILRDNPVDVKDFRDAITFIREYADRNHHGKEEEILFKSMLDNLGVMGENLIRRGMFVEHDQARFNVLELENALNAYEALPTDSARLDIISHMMAYVYLLERHATKENDLVYPFAEKNLTAEQLEEVNRLTEDFIAQAEEEGYVSENLKTLRRLQEKYN